MTTTAVVFDATGGPEVLSIAEVELPEPRPDQIVVEIAAAGVNFIDTYQRSGLYPAPLPGRLGLEGAGTVIAAGSDVGTHKIGDRVAWANEPGSYATHLAVTAQRAVSVPDEVDLETAAAVMLQGMTAHYLANSTHPLGEDDVAVVWAAAGGVGRLLVQMAKHRGARVIACTSTQDKADEVVRLGADDVLLYRDVDVPAEIRRLTGGKGADVVYDSVGRDTFDVSLQLLRPRGLLVSFGQSSGPIEPLSVLRLSAAGSLFLTRPKLDDYTASVSEREWRASAVFDAITLGRLDVAIHDRYPLADAVEAHRALESGTTTGKLLLTV